MVSESKFRLTPNGRMCGDVKEKNSGGRSGAVGEAERGLSSSTSFLVVVAMAVAVLVVEAVAGLIFKEQEEELKKKLVDKNKVRRFVLRSIKRKKRLEEREFVLAGKSMGVWFLLVSEKKLKCPHFKVLFYVLIGTKSSLTMVLLKYRIIHRLWSFASSQQLCVKLSMN